MPLFPFYAVFRLVPDCRERRDSTLYRGSKDINSLSELKERAATVPRAIYFFTVRFTEFAVYERLASNSVASRSARPPEAVLICGAF